MYPLIALFALTALGAAPSRTSDRDLLPVREVAVFKDGHAFVLREGRVAPDAAGRVTLDELPAPVLGTFWPYASDGAKVVSTTAGHRQVRLEQAARDMASLLAANVGAEVELHVASDATLTGVGANDQLLRGRLVGLPEPTAEEGGASDGGATAPLPPVVLLATAEGTRVIPLERVRDARVAGELATHRGVEASRNRLDIQLAGTAGALPKLATVGLVYVQQGLRWIPSYRLDIDGAGHAAVALEATLVNDLIDLDDVAVHLVVGVPRFAFAGMVDPISLQALAVDIAQQTPQGGRFDNFMSNALMSQAASYDRREEAVAVPAAGPELVGGEASEDLYVYDLAHVTLARGERMTVPVTRFELTYRDVYVLDVPLAPPGEVREQLGSERQTEVARLLQAPKAAHLLRVANRASAPLTTAPVLVLRDGRPLSQGLLTYTPVGAETDVEINTAVDLAVEVSEKETGRKPSSVVLNGDSYGRVDLAGAVTITNHRATKVSLEVRRMVLGFVDQVGVGGKTEQKGLAEAWLLRDPPAWWSWWSWPSWAYHWNGAGELSWQLDLAPGEARALDASWHYFWR